MSAVRPVLGHIIRPLATATRNVATSVPPRAAWPVLNVRAMVKREPKGKRGGEGNRPHDALFEATFGTPEAAASLAHALSPTPLRERLTGATFVIEPGSFIDEELADRHTDLLCSARLADEDDLLFYFLFEHRSTPHADMPLRVLGYEVRIWEHYRATHKHRRRRPPIFATVIAHVPGGWNEPTAFEALFSSVPQQLGFERYLPRFELNVLDLDHLSDDDLRRLSLKTFQRVVFMMLRDGRDPDKVQRSLLAWRDEMRELYEQSQVVPTGLHVFNLVFRYLLEIHGEVRFGTFRGTLEQLLPGRAENVMRTIAEKFRDEGRQEGRQEERANVLRTLLIQRFGAITPALDKRLATASRTDLERALERILTAPTAAAVFE